MESAAIENIRAIVTTQWGKRTYRPRVIRSIEEYFVDTSLDNDSDPFSLNIGDPHGDLISLLERDNEVRVQIFGVASTLKSNSYILTGLGDEISYTDDGVVTITGRDLSSVATDSVVPPKQFRHLRAWAIVGQQARDLGIGGRLNLQRQGIVRKAQYTDGSESYWEFWHRLYRKEKMFIWMGADGSLNANRLAYEAKPSYFLGEPKGNEPPRIRELYIPVDSASIRKTTQNRVGEIWVYGHRGDNGFLKIQDDPTTRKWIKRPRRIMMDTDARTEKAALRTAFEEIFEGKVGSMEYTITIPDPGFQIRQNRIARVRIPSMKLFGDFFVVGVRQQGSSAGAAVEIRLRERQYAISRRVPKDPKLKTGEPEKDSVRQQFSETLDVPYANEFIKAAREFHGPWNYELFLATLIAIGHQETGGSFNNTRANGGPGEDRVVWYPWAGKGGRTRESPDEPPTGAPRDRYGRTLEQWRTIFANEPSSYTNGKTYAVGIMQLYTLLYKHWADDYLKPGNRDQFTGGRWDIESNIRAGARTLRAKLQTAVRDSGRDIDIWAGVSYYGHHYADEVATTVPTKYAVSVKNLVFHDPGYLTSVRDALDAARQASKDESYTDEGGTAGAGTFVKPLRAPIPETSAFNNPDPEGAPDNFGIKRHAALDWFGGGAGSPIYVPQGGKVVEVIRQGRVSNQVYGGVVKIQIPSGIVWVFRHVQPADNLRVGMRLVSGLRFASIYRWPDTPSSSHVHIEIWKTLSGGYDWENMIDPVKYMRQF